MPNIVTSHTYENSMQYKKKAKIGFNEQFFFYFSKSPRTKCGNTLAVTFFWKVKKKYAPNAFFECFWFKVKTKKKKKKHETLNFKFTEKPGQVARGYAVQLSHE